MAHTTPLVREQALFTHQQDRTHAVLVESPQWYQWLESASGFRCVTGLCLSATHQCQQTTASAIVHREEHGSEMAGFAKAGVDEDEAGGPASPGPERAR